MSRYEGITDEDKQHGGGAYVQGTAAGHEAFNFRRERNIYRGYVKIGKGRLNLARLGARPDQDQLSGVTVIWVATHPTEKGQRVVGWYEDATVFRDYLELVEAPNRTLPDGDSAAVAVTAPRATLLPPSRRTIPVAKGKGGMGQANVWYPPDDEARRLLHAIHQEAVALSAPRATQPRQPDVGRRLRIEETAMRETCNWFARRGYTPSATSPSSVSVGISRPRKRASIS